jgi:hypothetical protein
MSDPDTSDQARRPPAARDDPEDSPSKGPNLVLIYGLIALSMIAAIGFALLIVLPFYHRR